jgi:hypothetical protein
MMTDATNYWDRCKVPGCEEPVKARRWCRLHYNRWYRHRDKDVTDSNPPGRQPYYGERMVSVEEMLLFRLDAMDAKLDQILRRIG